MRHRHISPHGLTHAAINDIIVRGQWRDWAELRHAARRDRSVLDRIERVCAEHARDPLAQRHHFWMRYATEFRKSS